MMLDLDQVRERALRIQEMAEDGQKSFSRRLVLTRLVTPLLQLIEAGMENRSGRWLTLEEAVTASGKHRKYFDKPLKSLGGRSRLQVWREDGYADQTSTGLWLISPTVLPPRRDTADRAQGHTRRAPGLDLEALADELTRSP